MAVPRLGRGRDEAALRNIVKTPFENEVEPRP